MVSPFPQEIVIHNGSWTNFSKDAFNICSECAIKHPMEYMNI